MIEVVRFSLECVTRHNKMPLPVRLPIGQEILHLLQLLEECLLVVVVELLLLDELGQGREDPRGRLLGLGLDLRRIGREKGRLLKEKRKVHVSFCSSVPILTQSFSPGRPFPRTQQWRCSRQSIQIESEYNPNPDSRTLQAKYLVSHPFPIFVVQAGHFPVKIIQKPFGFGGGNAGRNLDTQIYLPMKTNVPPGTSIAYPPPTLHFIPLTAMASLT